MIIKVLHAFWPKFVGLVVYKIKLGVYTAHMHRIYNIRYILVFTSFSSLFWIWWRYRWIYIYIKWSNTIHMYIFANFIISTAFLPNEWVHSSLKLHCTEFYAFTSFRLPFTVIKTTTIWHSENVVLHLMAISYDVRPAAQHEWQFTNIYVRVCMHIMPSMYLYIIHIIHIILASVSP